MYNEETSFSNNQTLDTPLNIIFGDGENLQAIRRGDTVLKINLPDGKTEGEQHFV